MNNRRKLIVALGAGALAAPFGSFAQQPGKVWRVGYLTLRSGIESYEEAFVKGLRELGYVEKKNLIIEWRFADGKSGRLPDLAAELLQLKMDVVVTNATPATKAVQKLTNTIPIVMVGVGDPVGAGLVKSLARPGGNTTGLSNITGELGPKHLEMLLSIAPKVARVAVLVDPNNSVHMTILKSVQSAAPRTGVNIVPTEASSAQEIEDAFSRMIRANAKAVIICGALFNSHLPQIAKLATKHRLPSIAAVQSYTRAGGLMSYGPNPVENSLRAATYVDKIFKGTKPADIPVEQPTLFELYINGKTVKALGLKIPHSLLILADKVIE
jgi:putative ABC transport system substrate-binding protein